MQQRSQYAAVPPDRRIRVLLAVADGVVPKARPVISISSEDEEEEGLTSEGKEAFRRFKDRRARKWRRQKAAPPEELQEAAQHI